MAKETICPVMDAKVDVEKAKQKGLVSEYKGKTYFFCCPSCKPEFDANPAKYTKLLKEAE